MPPAAAGLIDGVALAALVGGNADEARRGLSAALAAATDARLAALAALSREERVVTLGRLSRRVRGAPDPRATAIPRALALLAVEVPREVGAAWLAAAPPVRRGYRADDGLRHTLRWLVATPPAADDAHDVGVADRERGRGRITVARAAAIETPAEHARLLETIGPEEAAAVLALAALPPTAAAADADATAARPALLAALVREASRLARGPELVRALGALALGATGDSGGDVRSRRWREVGAELARIDALATSAEAE